MNFRIASLGTDFCQYIHGKPGRKRVARNAFFASPNHVWIAGSDQRMPERFNVFGGTKVLSNSKTRRKPFEIFRCSG